MIGSLMMCVSVVIFTIGMVVGVVMGVQDDFTLAPAHAHFNLIGGVLLFLFGLYYRLVPAAGTSRLAVVQGWLHMVGAIVFPIGIALVRTKGHDYKAVVGGGSVLVFTAMVLFAIIVLRNARSPIRMG